MVIYSRTEQVAVGIGLAVNSIFSILNYVTNDHDWFIYSYRFLSNLIIEISQVYFTIRAVNVFSEKDFAVDFNNLLGQSALIGQTLTSAAFWIRIYWNTNVYFADDPLKWISTCLSHGVPLLALIAEQILVPTVYDEETLRFIMTGLLMYASFDAVLTIASEGTLNAYKFLKWNRNPLEAAFAIIFMALFCYIQILFFMQIW